MKNIVLSLLLTLLSPTALLFAQQDIVINARGTSFDIGRNLAWGSSGTSGANNDFTVYSVMPWPTSGACVYIRNNNPSSSHAFTATFYTDPDPKATSFLTSIGWNQTGGGAATIPSLSQGAAAILGYYVPLSGSVRFAISLVGSTSQTGTPDTADIYAVATNGSVCGTADASVSFVSEHAIPSGGATGTSATTTSAMVVKIGGGTVYSLSAQNPNGSAANVAIYDNQNIAALVWCEALPAGGHADISFPTGLALINSISVAPSTSCSSLTAPASAMTWSITYK